MPDSKKVFLFFGIFFVVAILLLAYGLKKLSSPAKYEIGTPIKEENDSGLTIALDGFRVGIFSENVPDARTLEMDPYGALIVAEPSLGKIIALRDRNGDGKAEDNSVVIEDLTNPHGIAFRCENGNCKLFVAETDKLSVFDYSTSSRATNGRKLLDLPAGGRHVTRSLLFLPFPEQDKLIISVGSSCNVCEEQNSSRAKILEYDTGTGKTEEFARGLRNAVFMDLHPVSGKVFATEMGRDGLGDSLPPDEINIIEKGKNYGWPICYGKNIHDLDFDRKTYIRNPCMEPFEIPALVDIPAHSAPLGLAFIPEEGWPSEYWYDLVVAFHGSTQTKEKVGYKIVRLKMGARGEIGGSPQFEDFITGFLPQGKVLGRPADIKIFPGGVMYFSDDLRGIVYRVSRK